MIAGLSFAPEAREELFEAADFYDGESPGLGAAFLTSVEKGLLQISTFPESSPVALGTSRVKALQRFPYSLVYALRPSGIRILAVMSQKRRPFYWLGRE